MCRMWSRIASVCPGCGDLHDDGAIIEGKFYCLTCVEKMYPDEKPAPKRRGRPPGSKNKPKK